MPQNPLPDQFFEVGYVVEPNSNFYANPTLAGITAAVNLIFTLGGLEIIQVHRRRVFKKNSIAPLAVGDILYREKGQSTLLLADGFYYFLNCPLFHMTVEDGAKNPIASQCIQILNGQYVATTSLPSPTIAMPIPALLAIPSGSSTPVHAVSSTYSGVASTGGQASGLGYLWTSVSGVVPVFGSSQAAVTTAVFPTAGAFVISLAVNDPQRRGYVSTVQLTGTAS